jgi:hypothetical protein
VRPCLPLVRRARYSHNFLRARSIGFYHGVGAFSLFGSGPSLCPGPVLQGVSYVQTSGLGSYIRKQMPIRAPAGLSLYNRSHYPVGHRYPILPPDRTFFHPTSGKRNSAKFAVASIRRRRGVRASGWGYAGFLSTIVDTLAASVARNRGKRAQVVAFQLPENFRTSLSYATGFATASVCPPEPLP